MKYMMLVLCLAAAGALPGQESLISLPSSEFADTEVTTNCPFDFGKRFVRDFRFALTFTGTASNCVELAFGCDADMNGVLDAGETGMTFAWDSGEWHLADPDRSFSCVWEPQTTNGVKNLQWNLRVVRCRARRLVVSENGMPLAFGGKAEDLERLFDPEWNAVRLTVRGVDEPEETAHVKLDLSGYVIEVR